MSIHTPSIITSLRGFARAHDELPAFHAGFMVLTFLAAAMLNLGFFGFLVLVHMSLDIVKYREVHRQTWKRTAEGVFRESIVDIALFAMACVFSLYLHPSVTGITGVQGMMLAELTVLRGVGILTPKLKILYDFLKILSHMDLYLERMHPRMGKALVMTEWVSIFSIAVSLLLVVSAPLLLHVSPVDVVRMMANVCNPFTV